MHSYGVELALLKCTFNAENFICRLSWSISSDFDAVHSWNVCGRHKSRKKSLKTPILGFKVVQGHRYWYPGKACQQCLLWCAGMTSTRMYTALRVASHVDYRLVSLCVWSVGKLEWTVANRRLWMWRLSRQCHPVSVSVYVWVYVSVCGLLSVCVCVCLSVCLRVWSVGQLQWAVVIPSASNGRLWIQRLSRQCCPVHRSVRAAGLCCCFLRLFVR